jgi:DNA primase
MGLFTKDSIERVRDAIDMVELVGSKTDLRRVGTRWSGLCPFHDERTPSFSVDPESKLYHCFGCQKGGDAIRFVQEVEGLEFPEAVELLSERYNVRLEREDEDPEADRRRERRKRLLALLDRTATFYAAFLKGAAEAAQARAYLEERGFSAEILDEFRVGYSPSAWDRLLTGAQRDGYTPQELADAGLAQRNQSGNLYDRFRGRIMFPLADLRGDVLGFGARAMGEGRGPKYLNSSESSVYRKGRQLFGIDVARAHATKAGRVVVVEGYTDVLAMHQAGIRETVAIMGTALTEDQVAGLAKVARQVVLALDADRAGQEAMLRAARLAKDRDLDLVAVEMPAGSDPADLLAARGGAAMQALLDRASGMIEFQVRRVLADADLGTPAGRDRALEEARALIAAVPERTATRDALVREVADRLDLPTDYVTAAGQRVSRGGASRRAAMPAGSSPGMLALAPEREFLKMALAAGAPGREHLERLSPEHLSSEVTRGAREHLLAHFDDPLVGLPEDAPDVAALVTAVATAAGDRDEASDEAAQLAELNLRLTFLQLEQKRIDRELRRASEAADRTRQDELSAARQDVRREMDTVMGQMA